MLVVEVVWIVVGGPLVSPAAPVTKEVSNTLLLSELEVEVAEVACEVRSLLGLVKQNTRSFSHGVSMRISSGY